MCRTPRALQFIYYVIDFFFQLFEFLDNHIQVDRWCIHPAHVIVAEHLVD